MVSNSFFNLLIAEIIGFITKVAMREFLDTNELILNVASYLFAFTVLSVLMFCNVVLKSDFEKECLVYIKKMAIKQIVLTDNEPQNYLSFLTSELKLYRESAIESELNIIQNIITFFVSIIAIANINLKLFLVYFVATSLPFILTSKFRGVIYRQSKSWQSENLKFVKYLTSILKGSILLRSINSINYLLTSSYSVINDEEQEYTNLMKVKKLIGKLVILTGYIFSTFLPFFIGAVEVRQGLITLSTLMMLVQLANNLFDPIMQITQFVSSHYSAEPVIHKIDKLKSRNIQITNFSQKIDLPNVYVSIPKKMKFNTGLVLKIKKVYTFNLNKRILILGSSGIGKTTLLKSISGQYGIYCKGLNITSSKRKELFVYIDSNSPLFPGTVIDNITLNNDVDLHKLKYIIEMMGIKKLVIYNKFDKKKQIPEVSSGEKQRIALARALLLTNKFLLLDEVTSNLDEATSSKVRTYLFSINRGFIEISHELSEQEISRYDQVINLGGKNDN